MQSLRRRLAEPLSPGFSTPGQAASGGPTYSAEATALFARRTNQPDATRKGLMNALILSLLTGAVSGSNIWAKGDILSLYADADEGDARRNWISASYASTYGGGMSAADFTTDRGFTGDAIAKFLDLNFSDDTAAVNWSRDSASYGVWVNQDPVNSAPILGNIGTGANTSLTPRSTGSGLLAVRLHGGVSLTAAVANRLGFAAASRTSSTSTSAYKAGVNLGSTATASTGPVTSNLSVFRQNATYASDRVPAVWIGGALTDNEHLDLYNALLTYLTAIGAQ